MPGDVPPFKILHQSQVLAQEFETLGLKEDKQPTALCLSGGGIRSAAFCLGTVQALAGRQLLRRFHYLSTVSGGGFLGAWLTGCIAAQNATLPSGCGNVEVVEEKILASEQASEAPELRRLRGYTNFLTPRPGLASIDTWAGLVLWLRNTLVNWAIFFPLMLATAAVPVFYVAVICALSSTAVGWWISLGCAIAALLCLGVSVYHGCINLPSHNHPDVKEVRTKPDSYGISAREVLRQIVGWSLLWGFLVPWSLASSLRCSTLAWLGDTAFWTPVEPGGEASIGLLAIFVGCSVLVSILAYLMAWARVKGMGLDATHSAAFRNNLPGWTGSCLISGLVLLVGAWAAIGWSSAVIAVAGPVWVIAAELLRSAAYVAVRRDGLRTDLDREWLARVNADKLRIALTYGAGAAAVVFLPTFVFGSDKAVFDIHKKIWLVIATAILSGLVVALLGKVSTRAFSYGAKNKSSPIWKRSDWILSVGITVFIAALFTLLGQIAVVMAGALSWSFWTMAGWELVIVVAGGGIAIFLDHIIDFNRFSMHAVYRNRLVRAFLGTARTPAQRRPDRYAQFDPDDNVRMWDTFTERKPISLFPVINLTLNVTAGKDTARAERKGEPFVITPLHCGSASLRRDEQKDPGAYIPTPYFAGAEHETGPGDKELGISLGTAMTLSGAAMSPNMGYHSSPFVAFVMTLFNVRLGAWLPNPGWQYADGEPRMDKNTARRIGPAFVIPSLLGELIGLSDDRRKYVYLSDGGHFDNLGLYEMLRRRCSQVVVVDAGQDREYAYFDLAHTLQRAKIDMGLRVTFHPEIKVGGKTLMERGAYAEIHYPEDKDKARPKQRGELLYLKPWLPPDAPVELTAFKHVKQDFPHATTANQFFAESEFESYRNLGEYLTEMALKAAHPMGPLSLDDLFEALRPAPQIAEDFDEERRPDPSNSRQDDREDAPVVKGPEIQPLLPSGERSIGVRS